MNLLRRKWKQGEAWECSREVAKARIVLEFSSRRALGDILLWPWLWLLGNDDFVFQEAGILIGDLTLEGSVDTAKLEEFLLTKPNYVKVIRAGDGELTNHDIALLLANKASRTAELMAAGGSNLLLAGQWNQVLCYVEWFF